MGGFFSEILQYRTLFIYNPIFGAGILLIAGWLIGNVVSKIKLPHITGYIIAGILVGDSMLGIFPHQTGKGFSIITEIALGIIAITIGGEFYWGKFFTYEDFQNFEVLKTSYVKVPSLWNGIKREIRKFPAMDMQHYD